MARYQVDCSEVSTVQTVQGMQGVFMLLNSVLKVVLIPFKNLDVSGRTLERSDYHRLIWEDQYVRNPQLIIDSLAHSLGHFERVHPRKCQIYMCDTLQAKAFMLHNHVDGFMKCRYKFVLQHDNKLLAMITFAEIRKFIKPEGEIKSVELIQFAQERGYHLPGAFSKLLKFAIGQLQVNDVVTYASIDWSEGDVFIKNGFVFESDSASFPFVVHPESHERIYGVSRNPEKQALFERLIQSQTVYSTAGSRKFRMRIG